MLSTLLAALITFVPLDDRPVTRQLPQMLAQIAGERLIEPPRPLLGNYLTFGQPDAIIAWLNGPQTRGSGAFVISADMLAYGGLVGSRVPGVSYADAYFRLNEVTHLRVRHPHAWIGTFGTIMRLAPTGVPALGNAASFFAAYPVWDELQQYANLHDPPLASEEPAAQQLRQSIGDGTLQAYLAARARNVDVDLREIALTRAGSIDALVLGQDDAGPYGLHVKEVQRLQSEAAQMPDVAVEPGADELGMAMVAHALARDAHWTPTVAVQYFPANGGQINDPLEYAPIDVAVGSLISLCGARRLDGGAADITLFVRAPGANAQDDAALTAALLSAQNAHRPAALADLTFLENSFDSQARFAQAILASGIAARLDAYSSWNTNANTVGTAIAEAVAAGAGRRTHRYDALAHREFTFNRILDDVAFHDYVRPDLNRWLTQQGVEDHTYLLPDAAARAQQRNDALLRAYAFQILPQLDPGYHIAALQITLPWSRTFETQIEAALAPDL